MFFACFFSKLGAVVSGDVSLVCFSEWQDPKLIPFHELMPDCLKMRVTVIFALAMLATAHGAVMEWRWNTGW